MQIAFPPLLNIPTDCSLYILTKIDSNILVRTSSVCIQWLAILELEWKRRSQQLPQLSLKTSSTWREHYFLIVTGLLLHLRPLERMSQAEFLCTALGTTIFFIDKNLAVSCFKTDHKKEINIIKIIQRESDYYPLLFTSSLDKTVKVWQYRSSGNIELLYTSEKLDSYTSALLPLNSNFVSGGYNGNLYYWVEHKRKYQLQRVLEKVHQATIVCLDCYSNYIVSGAIDGTIGVSKLLKGKFQHLQALQAHNDAISCIVILSNTYLVTGGATGSALKIWDLQANPRRLTKIISDAHPGGVTDIKSYLYNWFFSSGRDGSIKVWDIESELYKITADYIPVSLGNFNKVYLSLNWNCTYLTEDNKIVRADQDVSTWKDINEQDTDESQT